VANERTKDREQLGWSDSTPLRAIGSAKNVKRIVDTTSAEERRDERARKSETRLAEALRQREAVERRRTAHGSPGILNRMDVITPPKSAPSRCRREDDRGGRVPIPAGSLRDEDG